MQPCGFADSGAPFGAIGSPAGLDDSSAATWARTRFESPGVPGSTAWLARKLVDTLGGTRGLADRWCYARASEAGSSARRRPQPDQGRQAAVVTDWQPTA